MTKAAAMQEVLKGRSARRASWPNGRTVFVNGGELWEKSRLAPQERYVSTVDDELANDWEVV